MTAFFEIVAYNTTSLYFWGAEADAERYADWLNRAREINVYAARAIPKDQWAEIEARDDVLSGDEPGWDSFMAEEE